MATTPILNLSTLVERPVIEIDGKKYQMLSPEELSVVDTHRFALWGQHIQEFTADEAKGPELQTLIDELAAKVLVGVPADVFAKLSGVQRFSAVEVFTMLLLARKAELVGAIGKTLASQTIGGASSPASSASSAATRAGGSSKRR